MITLSTKIKTSEIETPWYWYVPENNWLGVLTYSEYLESLKQDRPPCE